MIGVSTGSGSTCSDAVAHCTSIGLSVSACDVSTPTLSSVCCCTVCSPLDSVTKSVTSSAPGSATASVTASVTGSVSADDKEQKHIVS